jgi:hypothetical protein
MILETVTCESPMVTISVKCPAPLLNTLYPQPTLIQAILVMVLMETGCILKSSHGY